MRLPVSNLGLYLGWRYAIMTTMTASEAPPQGAPHDCVLIDDDAMIRATWSMVAKKAGQRLLAVEKSAEFWRHAPQLDRSILIYIDYSLATRSDGTSFVEELAAAGFSNLHIETGYDASEIDRQTRSLVKGIVGKAPPWVKWASRDEQTLTQKASR